VDDRDRKQTAQPPLRVVSPSSTEPKKTPPQPKLCSKATAAERAAILIGCYRRDECGDPEIYTRAVIDVLTRYPEQVALRVTEPATGLPRKLKWLPSIAELVEACEVAQFRFRPPASSPLKLVSYPLGKAPWDPPLPVQPPIASFPRRWP
jgi:hypothetical protein